MAVITLDNVTSLLTLARKYSAEIGTTLFYSGGTYETAKKSFLCLFPYDHLTIPSHESNPWERLKTYITLSSNMSDIPEWVGYLSYEMGATSDGTHVSLPLPEVPLAYFQRCAVTLIYHHDTQKTQLHIEENALPFLPTYQQKLIANIVTSTIDQNPPSGTSLKTVKHFETIETYTQKIERAKKWIVDGDLYQVNLSQNMLLKGVCNPFSLFERLMYENPAPFAAYMHMPHVTIVSSSPECFLKKHNTLLETRPIKGTAPRGHSECEDNDNRFHLLHSEKEKAELLMITDLMRNDLGKVSLIGTVETKKIWHCEAYTNVFHLLSIIQSRVPHDLHPIEIIRACFPAGSITGCPKINAMRAISVLEKRPRGIYTGSIGYIAGNGDFDFNVAIRTLTIQGDQVELQVGGAIVADSDPVLEYQETLHKAQSMIKTCKCSES